MIEIAGGRVVMRPALFKVQEDGALKRSKYAESVVLDKVGRLTTENVAYVLSQSPHLFVCKEYVVLPVVEVVYDD